MNVIGIDFGSQENKIGFFGQEGFQILANEYGKNSSPSYILFQEDGEHYYGQQAQNLASMYPKDTIFDIKRIIGRRFSEITSEEKERWPFTLKEGENDTITIVTDSYGEHDPIEVTGLIIKDLLQLAQNLGKQTDNVVICIPSYYEKPQKKAMIAAAHFAEIKNVYLYQEPLSAALWYSFWLSQVRGIEDNRSIIILDLGAETFSLAGIYIMQTENEKKMNFVKKESDLNIGGKFFDYIIYDYALQQFENQTTLSEKNKRSLLKKCEEAKIQLSISETAKISLEIDDTVLTATISNTWYKQIIKNILCQSKVTKTLESLIQKSKDQNLPFDLAFIGGSAYSTTVQDILSELLGDKVQKQQNPEEFIVKGACLYAANYFLQDQLTIWKNLAQKNEDLQRYKTFDFIQKLNNDNQKDVKRPPYKNPNPVEPIQPSSPSQTTNQSTPVERPQPAANKSSIDSQNQPNKTRNAQRNDARNSHSKLRTTDKNQRSSQQTNLKCQQKKKDSVQLYTDRNRNISNESFQNVIDDAYDTNESESNCCCNCCYFCCKKTNKQKCLLI